MDQIKGKDKVGREKLEEIAESLGIDYTNKNDDDLRKAIEGAVNKEKVNLHLYFVRHMCEHHVILLENFNYDIIFCLHKHDSS